VTESIHLTPLFNTQWQSWCVARCSASLAVQDTRFNLQHHHKTKKQKLHNTGLRGLDSVTV
jgi:hypothetical protein